MKRLRTAVCFFIIAVCLPGIFLAAGRLPQDNSTLVGEKYAGWSGVLRIWAFEGWTGGDLASGWINGCSAAFEKAHNGVYVQVKYVDAEAIRSLGRSGVRAPDMILFPPGLMDSADGLALLESLPVRDSLAAVGGGYACPVALGGYAWAINDGAEGTALPDDEDWRSWSAAAAALGDPGAIMEEIEIDPPGIDLGLPASATGSTPLSRFIAGELNAVPVTQRELARLNRLQDQGRGPEWRLQAGTAAWTDQVLYMSVLASGDERESLSMALLSHLLSAECQARLSKVNLFSVADAPTGYPSGSAMELIDLSLLREGLTVTPAFNDFSRTLNP